MSEAKNLLVGGLWKNNSALVQLLGLCPLLAVTATATNALGLGLATTLVLTHNWLGRTYLAVIMPFHRLIVPAMLRKAGG